MKITRIELWHVRVPLPAPFHPSWIPGMAQEENRFDLVRLVTASGLEGWSAAPAMGAEREGLGALLGPYLLGERADDLVSIQQRIREMGYLGWRVGWLEAACWDIVGKARGKPVWRLLAEHAAARGGPPVPAQAPRLRLYASTGTVRTGAYRKDEIGARLSEGFGGVKLRVHDASLEADLAQIREARQGVGEGPTLMVDANQGWRVAVIAPAPLWDLARAIAFCEEAARLRYAWVEEPLPQDAYADMVALRAALAARGARVAIGGGELNNQGLPELLMMAERGCLDLYQPDAVFTGGIGRTWQFLRRLPSGAAYSPHTWTNGIGFAINLQLFAATLPGPERLLEYPYDPPGWVPEARDGVLAKPWTHQQGWLDAPEAPGLGFEIDPSALRRHGSRFFLATPLRVAVRAVLDRGLASARALGATRDARLEARSAALGQADPVTLALEEDAHAP